MLIWKPENVHWVLVSKVEVIILSERTENLDVYYLLT